MQGKLAVPAQDGGAKHRLHALQDAPRRLWFLEPDGRQHLEDGLCIDLGDRRGADLGHDIALHGAAPLRNMLAVRQRQLLVLEVGLEGGSECDARAGAQTPFASG